MLALAHQFDLVVLHVQTDLLDQEAQTNQEDQVLVQGQRDLQDLTDLHVRMALAVLIHQEDQVLALVHQLDLVVLHFQTDLLHQKVQTYQENQVLVLGLMYQ